MYYIWFMLKRCKVGILTKKECKHRKFGKWKTKALVFGTSDLWLTYFAREFGFNDLKGKKSVLAKIYTWRGLDRIEGIFQQNYEKNPGNINFDLSSRDFRLT